MFIYVKQFAFITVENTVRNTKTYFKYTSQSWDNCIPNARYKIIRYEMRITIHRPLVARVSGLSLHFSHPQISLNGAWKCVVQTIATAFVKCISFKTLSFNDRTVHESDKSRATLICGCDKSHVNHRLIPWKWLVFSGTDTSVKLSRERESHIVTRLHNLYLTILLVLSEMEKCIKIRYTSVDSRDECRMLTGNFKVLISKFLNSDFYTWS